MAGHIPGAANLPFAELAPGGRFLTPDELRARFEAAGAAPGRELVAYCGSGVTACVLLLAAELAGLEGARLYPGSWSEWSAPRAARRRATDASRSDAQPQQRARRRALGVGRVLARERLHRLGRRLDGHHVHPPEQLHPGEPGPVVVVDVHEQRGLGPAAQVPQPRAGSALRFGFSSIALHTAPLATANVTGSTRGWSSSSTRRAAPTRSLASSSRAQPGKLSSLTGELERSA